jgi:hypothetical protein
MIRLQNDRDAIHYAIACLQNWGYNPALRLESGMMNRQENLEIKVMSTEEVVKSYYESQNQKDDLWKDLWADDVYLLTF